jgi:hypothetical protein
VVVGAEVEATAEPVELGDRRATSGVSASANQAELYIIVGSSISEEVVAEVVVGPDVGPVAVLVLGAPGAQSVEAPTRVAATPLRAGS